MISLTYVGPHEAVDVAALDWRTVRNGESTEVDDAIALDLLEQPNNWLRTPKGDKDGKGAKS